MLWKNQTLMARGKHKKKTVEELTEFKKVSSKKTVVRCHSYVAGKVKYMPIMPKYAGLAEVFRLEVGRLDIYECFCTSDQKFLTFGGMIELKDLVVGDDFVWLARYDRRTKGWYIETERVKAIELWRGRDDVYSMTTQDTKNFIISSGICCGADYAV